MKQVLVGKGQARVRDVPDTLVEPGTVLVRVARSCISVGTEMSGVSSSGVPLWKKALAQPAKIKQVVEMVASQGLTRTLDFVKGTVGAEVPIGYSATGTVIAVGQGVLDLSVGQRVACAGAQCANHAELIRVPRNLCVAVPDAVDWDGAATVTLGAIALQGVRRAVPTLGECFVVVGLGLLGQMTVQLLKSNGCSVIGIDPDAKRAQLAQAHGLDWIVDGADPQAIARLTKGAGADGVIVTASSSSPELLANAFKSCRKKGRVVLVGDVPITIDRADIYAKELDFFISTSYGPGRYDRHYEEEGADYPLAYVRWTENRNMEAWLDQLAQGRVSIVPLIGARYCLDQAPQAYESLKGADRPLIVLLDYPETPPESVSRLTLSAAAPKSGVLQVALIGGGAFAKAVHLPNLKALGDKVALRAVVSRSGHNARSLATQFEAAYAATDAAEVFNDPAIDAVIIATRHDHHAPLVLEALKAGKHVFVEKPLALTETQLAEIEAFYQANPNSPVLVTGFNRRASPFALKIAALTSSRTAPMIVTYRMNAGFLPADHWTHGAEGGGRNLGEACHIYDLFTALTNSPCVETQALCAKTDGGHYRRDDNFTATFRFEDGSVATLTYTALGASAYPKERMEVFCDGKVFALDDYHSLAITGGKDKGFDLKHQDKGHQALLAAFIAAASGRQGWPIPLWQQLQASRMALAVDPFLYET